MPLVGPEPVVADDVASTCGNVALALDVFADVVQTERGSLFIGAKHVGKDAILNDDRGIIGVDHADVGITETHVIDHALRTNDADRTLPVLGVADVEMGNAVGGIHRVNDLDAVPLGRARWKVIAGGVVLEGCSRNAGELHPHGGG